MNYILLSNTTDTIINAPYELVKFDSAKELAEKLKKSLKQKGIDYNKYNSDADSDGGYRSDNPKEIAANPPSEIYEYQNFFLLKRKDGDFALLDGFRRLLWYKAPDAPILVRIYDEKDLAPTQILTLLIYLNHFKFYAGGEKAYQERGFSLLLQTVFDINITPFRSAFDAYLSKKKAKNDYSGGRDSEASSKKISTIKERILNPNFINDMQFIDALKKAGGMVNSFFGGLLFHFRSTNDKPFDSAQFLKLLSSNKVLPALMVKYEKEGTNSSSKSQACVNAILEIYETCFNVMLTGGEVKKGFAEKLQDAKEMIKVIQKDKSWTQLTGTDAYSIDRIIHQKIQDGKQGEIKYKCVILPKEDTISEKFIYESGFVLSEKKSERWHKNKVIDLRIVIEKNTFSFEQNWGSGHWSASGKHYGHITHREGNRKTSLGDYGEYDCCLFVNIPKSEIPKK